MSLKHILFATSLLAISASAAVAEDPYRRAVMNYQAHHYSAALTDLEKLVAQYPNNAMVRYYRALAYQGTNQMSLARKDFEWVATNCPDGKVKQQAAAGLRNLGGYTASTTSGYNSLMNNGVPKFFAQAPSTNSASSGSSSSSTTISSSAGGSATSQSSGSGVSRPGGKLQKILEFTSQTCGPCITFAPIFEQTKSKFPDIDMQALDVADAGNAALVEQYSVKNYPTLVFISNTGNLLLKRAGAPVSVAQFSQLIDMYR
ncbi:MAG: hypothetical protein EKK48_23285 [Candidatus Melainabacteria bacterium]|nr:MAG: hypothetical protein EKK48_23285 [Candidatus Melainabacteria bacterium]